MLRYEDALARLLALAAPILGVEDVPVEDADGRVLAADLAAPHDLPLFDYSSMDGYAVRTGDLGGEPPYCLPVRGESKTGMVPAALPHGAVMRIFTGAKIPDGADTVVMQENVTRQDDVAVLGARPQIGHHIRRRGEDLAAGGVALRAGTRLRPTHLSLAASLDRATVPVARRPDVAVLSTGDELRPAGSPARPGTIPESNTVVIRSMARRAGAVARALPYVPDERAATERAFAAALDTHDVLVTVGGVSVGDHDLVRPALAAIGVTLDFWRVALKPGKPIAVGTFPRSGRRDAIVIGLPGNPSSAMVTFAMFGLPLLRALQGDAHPRPTPRRARITHAFSHVPGRLELARARFGRDAVTSALTVTALANQASGAVTSMAEADALLVVPDENSGLGAGEEVDVLALADLGF